MSELSASGSTRKFVNVRAKTTASEMRVKAAMEIREKQSTDDNVEKSSIITSETVGGMKIPIHIDMKVDPVDYDQMVKSKEAMLKDDPNKDLLLFPEDDVSVQSSPRELRTVRSSLPKQAQDPMIPVYLQDIFNFYTADWTMLNRQNREHSKYPRYKKGEASKMEKKTLIPQKFEIDLADDSRPALASVFAEGEINALQKTDADPRVLDFMKPNAGVPERSTCRPPDPDLMVYFRELEGVDFQESLDERPSGAPFKDRFGRRFLIECVQLSVGTVHEPLFGTLALYDLKSKKKISEDFNFDTNSAEISDMLTKFFPTKEFASMSKQALFQVNYPNPDVYFILKVDKVLEGDINETYERYSGNNKIDKLTDTAKEFCSRLGQYRQPFLWSAVSIFNATLDLDVGQDLRDCTLQPLMRYDADKLSDNDLIEAVTAMNSNKGSRKFKTVPGFLKYKLTEVQPDELIPNCFTPFLVPVKPFTSDEKEVKLVREIEEFPQHPIVHPHIDYVNTLYVYPLEANLTKYSGSSSARNIAIKVQFLSSSDQVPAGANAMKAIYGKSSCKAFNSEVFVPVNFHTKTPTFHEEIKIALPLNLTKAHHILFTFIHVSCTAKKGKEEETVISYAWLPVFDGKIVGNEEHSLPMATELEKNYDSSKTQKFLDNKKPQFKVRTKLVSSVFSDDEKLHNFFNAVHEANKPGHDDILLKGIENLKQAGSAAIVQFGPVLLDELFRILGQTFPSDEIPRHAFLAVVDVVTTINSEKAQASSRDPSLVAYVNYRYANHSSSKKLVFEEITRFWLTMVEEKHASTKNLEKFSWFFYELIVKSIVQYLKESFQWKSSIPPDAKWFKPQFMKHLETLLSYHMRGVVSQFQDAFAVAKELNESIAYLITDCFPFMDRHLLFSLVQKHCEGIQFTDHEQLIAFKFDFLKIIAGYEHFVPLNFPTRSAVEKPFDKLTNVQKDFWERHYLAGLLLWEVSVALDNPSKTVRTKALSTLKDVLVKHELDPRINNPDKRARVAGIYFSFFSILVAHFSQFNEEKPDDYTFTPAERRLAMICVCYILKNIEKKWLLEWLRRESIQTFTTFLDLIGLALEVLQYSGKDKIAERRAANQPSSKASSASSSVPETPTRSSLSGKGSLREKSEKTLSISGSVKHSKDTLRGDSGSGTISSESPLKRKLKEASVAVEKRNVNMNIDIETEIKLEGALTTEVTLVLLDVFDLILSHQNPKSAESPQAMKMFSLLPKFVEYPQSESAILQLFGTLKAFIFKFPQAVFKDGTTFCSDLCHIVLKFCASQITIIRQYASTLLYLLMKKNFEATKSENFMKVRVQTTVALSKLILQDDNYLRRSLATIVELSQEDDLSKTKFPKLVKEAADRLFLILRDRVKMAEHRDDTDMMVDMQHRISQGYMNAPDLRLATLEALYKLNFSTKNWAEAAGCQLHSAALVAQCLKTMSQKKGSTIDMRALPDGAKAFRSISENLLEEEASTTEGEGIGESPSFSEKGLVTLLTQSVNQLRKAQMWETINEVYKLLLPIYEKNRSFEMLATAHFDLHKDFQNIHQTSISGKRLLGTYFRVAFFGNPFKTLNGVEFVYKERAATPLSEISNRLEGFYAKKFGAELVKQIHDSGTVDVSKLNQNMAYIQITFCEPYFTEEEQAKRMTYFEKNNNLRYFVFETPYTTSGKAHGSVEDQHMRKTILETETSFPYVKKRVRVSGRKEVDLLPLDVSIEAIANRVQSFKTILSASTVDPKALQLILQGSVRLQVNEGPLEIANTFLSPEKVGKYPAEKAEKLRERFRDFLGCCYNALSVNRSLVKHDQRAYQDDLEEGFEEVKKKLWPFVSDGSSESYKLSIGMKAGDKDVLSFISGVDEE